MSYSECVYLKKSTVLLGPNDVLVYTIQLAPVCTCKCAYKLFNNKLLISSRSHVYNKVRNDISSEHDFSYMHL